MIHIVFQEADVDVLQKAIELDETLAGEVWQIRDDYAVGPISEIYEPEGYQARRAWWKDLIDFSPYNTDQLMNMVDDRMLVHQLKNKLDENEGEIVWIWMGQNAHDVCGYYWFISLMQEYAGRIFVLYLNNLPFINEKGQLFYPTSLQQIQPKEFLKAKKLNRTVNLSEFEVDGDEWKRLCTENKPIRILEGGKKIVGKDATYFDADLLSVLTKDWQKGHRYFSAVYNKAKIPTGDVFLIGRLKTLSEEGVIEIGGTPSKGWKDFEVRLMLKGAALAEDAMLE